MHTATAAIAYDKLSDLELAQCIASGDKDAFELLMRRHNQILYRTARSILKDDAEAEDAVQEAWLHRVLGLGIVLQDASRRTVEDLVVPPHQQLEGILVAGCDALRQLQIR